ncbi:hypothetical protein Aduo_017933 [Ancylostoma duodenale]
MDDQFCKDNKKTGNPSASSVDLGLSSRRIARSIAAFRYCRALFRWRLATESPPYSTIKGNSPQGDTRWA